MFAEHWCQGLVFGAYTFMQGQIRELRDQLLHSASSDVILKISDRFDKFMAERDLRLEAISFVKIQQWVCVLRCSCESLLVL